jgi:hypothetical protein
MLTLTIHELAHVYLYDLDNGTLVLDLTEDCDAPRYIHAYEDAAQLATDLLEIINDGEDRATWDGNEADDMAAEVDGYDDLQHVRQIINGTGVFSGHGGAYTNLVRALAQVLPADMIA